MNAFEIIAYPLLPVAAMELLLGFLLLTQNRRSSRVHSSVAAIAFFSAAYSLNTAVMYLMASHGHDFTFFARLNWIGWFAIPAGLQFLFYVRSEGSRAARITGYVLYPYWALVLAVCLFTDLIVTPGYSLIPYANDPGPLETPARVVGSLMTIWLIVDLVRIKRRLTGIKKFQLNYFFHGLLIYSFSGVAIAGIMPVLGDFTIEPGLGSYFSLPWVALTFYAIVRHSLFEMRIIFSRTLAVIILVLACSALQAAVLSAIAPALGTALSVFVSLSLLGFFLFGTPVSGKIQSLVDSLIIGGRYRYESMMREAIVTLNTKKEGHELLDHLIETTCSGLGVADVGIYLYRVEDGFVLRAGRGRFLDLKDSRSLADIALKKLQEANESLILNNVPRGDDNETYQLTAYLRGIGADALVPLLFQQRLLGALILGRKTSGEAFGQSDVRFLETLAAHAASALENARLNDITRKIRSSLQESEERFISLAAGMPAAVFIHRGASIVYANKAAEDMTGYDSGALVTMTITNLIHPESSQYRVDGNGPGPGGRQRHQAGQEVRVLQANGSQRWAVMTSAIIEYGERAAVIAILFDITDHKQTEGRLRYERTRDAVARMADYLLGDLERLMKDLRHVEALQEYGEEGRLDPELARKLMIAKEQAEFLVRTVKEFGPRQGPKRSLQDMNDLVVKRRPLLAAMLAGNCEIVMRPATGPLLVMADPARIESALMNLVLHARDRMPRGGVITVATLRASLDADFIRNAGYGIVGAYASISVSDTGENLTPEEQERIFEPFFARGDGWKVNGLGLSMVYDIVKEHEGYITVTRRPEGGSSFLIYLPLQSVGSR
jgi:PAS domain S-box-containing protein